MPATSKYAVGFALSITLTLLARFLIQFPLLNILGAMVTAILLGIVVRTIAEPVVTPGQPGINFTAKYLLRLGIILMGVRLNISDIIAAGWQTIVIDIAVILFAIIVITWFGRKCHVDRTLTSLIAVGTGVCGAAAIGAVAPLIKAKNEDVAISVTIIATLGTVFTILYTALLPILGLTAHQYGVFSGSTLHELAHVIAASAAGGSASSDIAILVKLGRVALLAPVAMLFGWLFSRQEQHQLTVKKLPIPWFIFGFLVMSLLNTYHVFSDLLVNTLVTSSMFLLTMAMGALGLNVRLADFRRVGHYPILIGLIGSVLLSLFGFAMIRLLAV